MSKVAFVLPTGPGETRVLTDETLWCADAMWLPDGRRVVVVGREPGHDVRSGNGKVARHDEIPYDVQTPWPDTTTNAWDEAELIELLASRPDARADFTD